MPQVRSKMKLQERLIVIPALVVVILFIIVLYRSESNYIELKSKIEESSMIIKSPINLHRSEKTEKDIDFEPMPKSLAKVFVTDRTILPTTTISSTTRAPRVNKFQDMDKYTTNNPRFRAFMEWPPFVTVPPDNPRLADIMGLEIKPESPSWERFNLQISKQFVYEENSSIIDDLEHDLATQRIVAVEQLGGGMQLKLLFTFANGGHGVFKPQRYPKEQDLPPNVLYMMEYERHNAEIAAYHFDRIIGFRRVPPHVGRKVNITSELYPLVDEGFLDTFFYSPDGNYCFHGKCRLYCDTHHAFCGNPDMIEGSVGAWILTSPAFIFQHNFIRSPWKRSYLPNTYAPWENDPFFCINYVRETPPFKEGRRIYDAIDCTIFDYIIGNWDRHHFNELLVFGNDSTSTVIHFDNGRGFGRADQDEVSILRPLEQCCIVRLSTFNKLYEFHTGPRPLSDLMRESLKKDPLNPVLTEAHLLAMDRRVEGVLDVIRRCVQANLPAAVFLDDILQTYFTNVTRFKNE